MPTANDPGSSTKYALRMANDVWRLLRCLKGTDRSANNTLIEIYLTSVAERIANSAFEIVTRLNKDHFAAIVRHGAFADLTVCITEFCKVSKYQKISLLAIAMLRGIIPIMLECPECSLIADTNTSIPMDDAMIKFWFPVLFGFYDIIMNGEDLEVRRLYVSWLSLSSNRFLLAFTGPLIHYSPL
jgi:Sec7-like guanine-nucleotide exchange factor